MDTSTQATELITVKGQSGTRPKRQYRPIEEKRKGVSRTHSCIDEFSESVTLELMSKSRAATQHGLIPLEVIERRIYFIRTHKVMLDSDLAELYGVRTKRLNEQVKRNIDRFPADFMFRLNQEESDRLRSQFATSKHGSAAGVVISHMYLRNMWL